VGFSEILLRSIRNEPSDKLMLIRKLASLSDAPGVQRRRRSATRLVMAANTRSEYQLEQSSVLP
jgi:hypothetical protein